MYKAARGGCPKRSRSDVRKCSAFFITFPRKQQYLQDDLNVPQQDVMNDLGRETSGFSFHFQLAIAWLQFRP